MQQEWKLFADLAESAGGKTVTVTVDDDATVGDALTALLSAHPDLRERVRDGDGVADDVNLLVDGEELRDDALARPLSPDDELALFPPVSGG